MSPSHASPQITVVAASYRRPDALATLLASLARQALPAEEFEVRVVVDGVDDSAPAYREVLQRAQGSVPFDLHLEFQPNAGQSVARHRAITASAAPWICVVDDDMDLLPGFLGAHLSALRAGGPRVVVIGRVIPEEGWQRAPLYEAVRTRAMLESHREMASGRRPPRGFALVTQNVSFGRDFYLSVGGFDERLRLGEDSELGLRFELAGGAFTFSEEAAAVHRSRVGSYRAWLRRCIEYGQNAVYIHEKLARDPRAHPLRNLVNGSALNAAVVHALCWWDPLALGAIGALHRLGGGLQRLGLLEPALATHKAILALAFHVGVRRALGSWSQVLEAKRGFARTPGAPSDPT
jgi:glycosyltransferase involved in cell wall biosynthesis